MSLIMKNDVGCRLTELGVSNSYELVRTSPESHETGTNRATSVP